MYNSTIGHILTIVHIKYTCTKNDSTVIVYYSIHVHVYYVSINNTVTCTCYFNSQQFC